MPDYYPKGAPSKTTYPYESGDVLVLGPEIFVSADRTVINWRGDNYYHPARLSEAAYNDHEPLR